MILLKIFLITSIIILKTGFAFSYNIKYSSLVNLGQFTYKLYDINKFTNENSNIFQRTKTINNKKINYLYIIIKNQAFFDILLPFKGTQSLKKIIKKYYKLNKLSLKKKVKINKIIKIKNIRPSAYQYNPNKNHIEDRLKIYPGKEIKVIFKVFSHSKRRHQLVIKIPKVKSDLFGQNNLLIKTESIKIHLDQKEVDILNYIISKQNIKIAKLKHKGKIEKIKCT